MNRDDLPLWFYGCLPISILMLSLCAKAWNETFYQTRILGESGLIENITLASLMLAIIAAIQILNQNLPFKILRVEIILILLGSIYFAGEEASWGQHIFDWSVSENWQSINLQHETNLHNIEGFGGIFDQFPRTVLTLTAFIGGILAPSYLFFKHILLNPQNPNYWLFPTYSCIPSASIAVLITLPEKIAHIFSYPLPNLWINFNAGEYKECFLAFFILFYLYSLLSRLLYRNR